MTKMLTLTAMVVFLAQSSPGRVVKASWYHAPTRSSFASRNREWRGKAFHITHEGKTVRAVCRDYGPARWTGRDIDVSKDVADRLGFTKRGVATVRIRRAK